MSKLKVYSVKDVKIGTYKKPFFSGHDEIAKRDFRLAVNDDRTSLYYSPADFELWYLAEFDEDRGIFIEGGAQLIETAIGAKMSVPEREGENGNS